MGQLERYGLYVLCLVIFLILGVAIWGGDPQPASAGGSPLSKELDRASNPIAVEPPAPDPAMVGANPYLGELLTMNNGVARPVVDNPPAAQRPGVEEASTPPAMATPATAQPASASPTKAAESAYYVVKQGDMLSEISQRELGRSSRWREIQALNPGVEEKNLKVGMKLRMPGREAGGAAPDREWFMYTVRKNDNPSKISYHLYGTQAYANKIMELNPGKDAKKLKPGEEIRVPLRK